LAIDTINRWQLVREVILQKRSGAIVLQTGRNYLHWILERGNLVCVSSTLPEASLTNTIQEQKLIDPPELMRAQAMVDQSKTLGTILLQRRMLNQEALQKLLLQHWVACTDYLFEPSMHLFWSTNSSAIKAEVVRHDRPLSDVLLLVDRSAITIPTALRTVQGLQTPYRLASRMPDLSTFNEEERRIWMHLQSGSCLKQILQDREITRIPCYKTLFLLWLTGYLCDTRPKTVTKVKEATRSAIHRIPAEWIFPLCAGALIGVLLAPSGPPKVPPKPAAKVERLQESLQKPAWGTGDDQTNDGDSSNAETQSRRDEK